MSHSELAEEQERGGDEKEDEQEEEEGGERRREKEEKKKEKERKMYLEKLTLTKKRFKAYLCVIFEHVYIKLMQAINFPELFLKKRETIFWLFDKKKGLEWLGKMACTLKTDKQNTK